MHHPMPFSFTRQHTQLQQSSTIFHNLQQSTTNHTMAPIYSAPISLTLNRRAYGAGGPGAVPVHYGNGKNDVNLIDHVYFSYSCDGYMYSIYTPWILTYKNKLESNLRERGLCVKQLTGIDSQQFRDLKSITESGLYKGTIQVKSRVGDNQLDASTIDIAESVIRNHNPTLEVSLMSITVCFLILSILACFMCCSCSRKRTSRISVTECPSDDKEQNLE